jgi:hypothetical protein
MPRAAVLALLGRLRAIANRDVAQEVGNPRELPL